MCINLSFRLGAFCLACYPCTSIFVPACSFVITDAKKSKIATTVKSGDVSLPMSGIYVYFAEIRARFS